MRFDLQAAWGRIRTVVRRAKWRATVPAIAAALLIGPASEPGIAQNGDEILQAIIREHRLNPSQAAALANIMGRYSGIWRTAASIAQHPVSEEQCRAQVMNAGFLPRRIQEEQICGRPYMVPIYPAGSSPNQAPVCIDQFEFPNLPCRFPLTWVSALDAARMCEAEGKRLCDAHEWEGACAGSLGPPDYNFGSSPEGARSIHNRVRDIVWAYGRQRRGDICAFGVPKSPNCDRANQTGRGVVESCGPNTYPAGYFSQCVSRFGVYDLHGNAAEHMNLPTTPDEMTSRGGLGVTEMKGSWFAFPATVEERVHPDDCRWRAPGWHRSRINDGRSHQNYHLGFRCCASR